MDWWLITIVSGLALLIPTAYAGWIGAPYAPTRLAAVKKAFDYIGLGSTDVVVDLGAGDGKILLEAHRRGARAIGYELSPILWLVSWLRTLRKGNIRVTMRNFYHQQLEGATVVFSFLMPRHMGEVKAFLQKQSLAPHSYFLAYAFPLPETAPLYVIREKDCAALYIYEWSEIR